MTEKVIKQCRRTWRRIGVTRDAIADMTAELEADLASAKEGGRDPRSYVGGEPTGFACAWASERGVVPQRLWAGRLMVAAVVGGLPGGLTGLFVAFGLSGDSMAQVMNREPGELEVPPYLLIVLYLLSGVFAWAGILGAASAVLRFHADAARQVTLYALATVIPFAGLAAAAGTALAARQLGYPYGVGYVLAEAAAPVVIIMVAVGVTRVVVVWALRSKEDQIPVDGVATSSA